MAIEAFEVKGFLRKSSQPCDDCGEVRDLVGEYPEKVYRCPPCNGVFTCRCCGWPNGEYRRRAGEFEGAIEAYVCPHCRDRCPSGAPVGECSFAPV